MQSSLSPNILFTARGEALDKFEQASRVSFLRTVTLLTQSGMELREIGKRPHQPANVAEPRIRQLLDSMLDASTVGTGQVFEAGEIKFSGMVDALFAGETPEIREMAIKIAREEYIYQSPSEIQQMLSEWANEGCCQHGLDSQTCPVGCFEHHF